jgi:allophanate hydrolase
VAIEIEVWAIPLEHYGSFVAGIPAPLGIGMLETEAGDWIQGFACDDYALADARNISTFGGWRAYLKEQGT